MGFAPMDSGCIAYKYSIDKEIAMYPKNNQYNPYFMSYSAMMPWNYQSNYDFESEQDMEYLKELYPGGMKQIQKFIDEECDKLEYPGSFIYDEYPDKMYLRRISLAVLKKIEESGMFAATEEAEEELFEDDVVEAYNFGFRPGFGRGCRGRNCNNNLLNDVVDVLLFNELFNRRCRHRGCRRFY